jgi:hypothetical protein
MRTGREARGSMGKGRKVEGSIGMEVGNMWKGSMQGGLWRDRTKRGREEGGRSILPAHDSAFMSHI